MDKTHMEKQQTCTLPIRQEKMGAVENCQGESVRKFFARRGKFVSLANKQ
jgi:hypothetical protein